MFAKREQVQVFQWPYGTAACRIHTIATDRFFFLLPALNTSPSIFTLSVTTLKTTLFSILDSLHKKLQSCDDQTNRLLCLHLLQ